MVLFVSSDDFQTLSCIEEDLPLKSKQWKIMFGRMSINGLTVILKNLERPVYKKVRKYKGTIQKILDSKLEEKRLQDIEAKKMARWSKLTDRILSFVFHNPKSISLGEDHSPMFSGASREYKDKSIYVKYSIVSSAMGSGRCDVTVKVKGKTVFDAHGSFTAYPYNMQAKVHTKGSWEKIFPRKSKVKNETVSGRRKRVTRRVD